MMVFIFPRHKETMVCTKNKCWCRAGCSRKREIGNNIDKVNMAEGERN